MKSAASSQIEALREAGYDVKVKQLRRVKGVYGEMSGYFSRHEVREMRKRSEIAQLAFHPHGGRTEVTITLPDGSQVAGEARCRVDNPERKTPGDPFSYRLGLTIALNRALKQLNGFNLTGHGSDGEGQ